MTSPDRPCGHFIGAESRHCGGEPTRLFIQGPRCGSHTPSAVAGVPEPQDGSCAPNRCYCARPECPAYPSYVRHQAAQSGDPAREAS